MSRTRHPREIWFKTHLARVLRAQATVAEQLVWEILRVRRCHGFRFKRQFVLQGFIVDFYWAELGLVLDLVGGDHDQYEASTQDRYRDLALEQGGVGAIRVRNENAPRDRIHAAVRAAADE